MSKLEKALNRAKQARRGDESGENRREDAPLDPLLDRVVRDGEATKPVYTETKVVSPDKSHLERHCLMTLLEDSEAADYYNRLRTQVLQRTRGKHHNAIMVTSALEGEGKTVTAINLAASLAREVKQTVLLADTDLRNPKIHEYLGCRVEQGLSDYLMNDVPIGDLLVNPGLSKMVVLPGGAPLRGSTEILGSPKMEKLVAEMKDRYPDRYCIFDCPPVLTVSDALVFSAYVDGVILVVRAGETSRDQIRKAVELLEGSNILGVVMNRGDGRPRGYYY